MIRAAGLTLIELLRDEMHSEVKAHQIQLIFPAETQRRDLRLSLFLYQISENPHLKHEARRGEPEGEAAERLSIESEGDGAQSDVRNR